jgi:flagellar hook assembly protein FlgD
LRACYVALVLTLCVCLPAAALACVGGSVTPRSHALYQNIPNPFNPTTSIPYMVQRSTHVVIGIYDVSGARVNRLDEGQKSPGTHTVTWNGRDAAGRALPSGVYFYRFEGFAGSPVKKMVLLK